MLVSALRQSVSAPRKALRHLAVAAVAAVLLSSTALIAPVGAVTLETKAREAYLVDFETGTVLYDKNGTT